MREDAGLRREDVAAGAGISHGYVHRLESEDPPNPSLDLARRIADVLGVGVDDVFPRDEVAS